MIPRLPQVAEAEEKTAGGLLLTEASKEKPSIGTVSVKLHFALRIYCFEERGRKFNAIFFFFFLFCNRSVQWVQVPSTRKGTGSH